MSEHTPEPWEIRQGGGHANASIVGSDDIQTNGWPKPVGRVSNASYSSTVCEFVSDLNLPGPMANARLIAAAPDLLRACREALEYEDDMPGGDNKTAFGTMLRAAITKAGKSES